MFWSKKKIDDDKDKQIRDLKQVFPSIRRPNNDDSLFEIKFVVDNQYSSLRIFIPADFPMTRPVLQVSGPVTHPWMDQFKQINGCDKLMNWSKSSSLVEVVEETMSALLTGVNGPSQGGAQPQTTANPALTPYGAAAATAGAAAAVPSPTYSPYGGVAAVPNPTYAPYTTANSAQMTPQQQQAYNQQMYGQQPLMALPNRNASVGNPALAPIQQPQNNDSNAKLPAASSSSSSVTNGGKTPITMPEIPNSFPELEKLTDLQLERLLNDSAAFDANMSKMASVESIRNLVDSMKQSNSDSASKNLILEGDITILQRRAMELHEQLVTASGKYNAKLAKVQRQFAVNKQDVLAELNKKKDALDVQSDDLGRSLVDGKVELAAFLPEFLESRTSYHALCSKISATSAQ